jgi:DNA-binding response OmpR family regulator/signal transduction histidine kinase
MNWRLVQRLLSQAGYEMHWAEDGLKGCEAAAALTPALILLDINLPGLSGFEVATKLRQIRDLDATRIVALTAKTMRSDRETALVTGCDGFISKPIDPFLFVGQVEGYLGGRRDRLDQGREGAALRHFSQQVVDHLEAQLKEAQESNRKLLEAQGELEQRSHHLSRLLALSKGIIPIQEEDEIQRRVLGQLHQELHLDHLSFYRLHDSEAYFQGLGKVPSGFEEMPVLTLDHSLINWVGTLPVGGALAGAELRQSQAWEQGIELGLWDPRSQPLLLPIGLQSEGTPLRGFLAADRLEGAFVPFEIELADLYAGILQVSLENAGLIGHLAQTSQALGTSYERMESAYEALKEAQRALGAQNQKTALGGLFITMAQRLQVPVHTLQEESLLLSSFMDRSDALDATEQQECHRSMDQVRIAISQVDRLVQALLRRTGQGQAHSPEWIHLHDLLQQELDFMLAEGTLPGDLPVTLNLQAPRDLIFGVYTDFAEVLGHLISHVMEGQPRQVSIRTWGGNSHFRLEVEDDGGRIAPGLLEGAFEPFQHLQPPAPGGGRHPGVGLPGCAQLMNAYGGTVQLQPAERGSIVRLSVPME